MPEKRKTTGKTGKKAGEDTRHNARSYASMAAVWSVLERYSSRESPMSVKEIMTRLKAAGDEDPPSAATVRRLMDKELRTLKKLFPGLETHISQEALRGAYVNDGGLHVVVENAAGKPLTQGKLLAIFSPYEGVLPSYATVDNLLKEISDYCLNTPIGSSLPLRLVCVAAANEDGETVYLPYDEVQENWSITDKGQPRASTEAKTRRYYVESVMPDSQWQILTDMIKVYPYIGEEETKAILEAIRKVHPRPGEGAQFYAFKKENKWLLKNLELLDQAIKAKQKVLITYGTYVLDERGKPVLTEREQNGELGFEPYTLLWSNGYYYLVGKNYGMMNLRVDRILGVDLLTDEEDRPVRFTPPAGFDPVAYRDQSPVMYPGTPELIRLRIPAGMISTVMDFFGEKAQYRQEDGGTVQVTLKVVRGGAKLFLMQYADKVTVLEPEELRQEMKDTLTRALAQY